MECKLETLMIVIYDGMKGDPNEISTLQRVDVSKKVAINDFLITNAIIQPTITDDDLNNPEHSLNDKFREIGDYLFEKYVKQYSEKILEKKKLMKSPLLEQPAPVKDGLEITQ